MDAYLKNNFNHNRWMIAQNPPYFYVPSSYEDLVVKGNPPPYTTYRTLFLRRKFEVSEDFKIQFTLGNRNKYESTPYYGVFQTRVYLIQQTPDDLELGHIYYRWDASTNNYVILTSWGFSASNPSYEPVTFRFEKTGSNVVLYYKISTNPEVLAPTTLTCSTDLYFCIQMYSADGFMDDFIVTADCPDKWVDHTDEYFFSNLSNFSWSTDRWVLTGNPATLETNDPYFVYFRPNKIHLRFGIPVSSVTVYDSDDKIIAESTDSTDLYILDLVWLSTSGHTKPIKKITVGGSIGATLREIFFYVDPGDTRSSSSSSTSSSSSSFSTPPF